MKKDPYKNKEKWFNWKSRNSNRISELSQINSDIILRYLNDMEVGINTSQVSKKGSRSYTRLNTIKDRIIFLTKQFKKRYDLEHFKKTDFISYTST